MYKKLLVLTFLFSFLIAPLAPAFADQAGPPADSAPVVTVETPQALTDASSTAPAQDVRVPDAATTTTVTEASTTKASDVIAPAVTTNGTVHLTIRYGEHVAWTGSVDLPATGTTDVTPTGASAAVPVDADSLLAVLTSLDAQSDALTITNLAYFPTFGSFIVNCVSSPSFSEACYQWQYVVDGTYPFVGIDHTVLHDGDIVYLYFGSPRRVTSPSTAVTGQAFSTLTESYDPSDNTYHALPGYTVGVTQPDPTNPFSPTEIATSTTGADGTASFTVTHAGLYGVGLKEDFYYPSVPLTVTDATTTPESSGSVPAGPSFNAANAFSFLVAQQQPDGSLGSDITTDWGAVAFAVAGAPSDAKALLAKYLKEQSVRLTSALDYERHAMALEALGINPYSGGRADYITPIVNSFDGTQIDEPGLVNDDIFAIFPLLRAGYSTKDEVIAKTAAFIVSKQRSDGSWEESTSVTSAAVQALSLVSSIPGASDAIVRAETYLRSAQKADGGFGDTSASDPFATSWALQATKSLGESPSDWTKNGRSPLDYLTSVQQEDGGTQTTPNDADTRAWGTAYAIPAARGFTWSSLLHGFSKTKVTDARADTRKTQKAATTTPETLPVPPQPDATSTPVVVATSTPAVAAEAVVSIATTALAAAPSHGALVPSSSELSAASEPAATTTHADLAAAAGNAEAANWLARLWSGFWHALLSFLAKIF